MLAMRGVTAAPGMSSATPPSVNRGWLAVPSERRHRQHKDTLAYRQRQDTPPSTQPKIRPGTALPFPCRATENGDFEGDARSPPLLRPPQGRSVPLRAGASARPPPVLPPLPLFGGSITLAPAH